MGMVNKQDPIFAAGSISFRLVRHVEGPWTAIRSLAGHVVHCRLRWLLQTIESCLGV